MNADAGRPVLRIVRGAPSPEELAALTALVTAATTGDAAVAQPPLRGRWNDPSHQHVRVPWPGPGAWRSAYR